MLTPEDFAQLDDRYVRKDDCNDRHADIFQMIVSEVGRTMSSSSSFADGSTTTPLPFGSAISL